MLVIYNVGCDVTVVLFALDNRPWFCVEANYQDQAISAPRLFPGASGDPVRFPGDPDARDRRRPAWHTPDLRRPLPRLAHMTAVPQRTDQHLCHAESHHV